MTSTKQARILAAIVLFQITVLISPVPGKAETAGATALTGRVSSQEEGPMEGVMVSARKDGATFTITVATDQQGFYSFPRKKLEPGQYALSIRAVGYEIDPAKVAVTAQKAASFDLKLRKVQDISSQLSNQEWLNSMPEDSRKNLILDCVRCHTLERIVRSNHNSDEFTKVMVRMANYYMGSLPGITIQMNPPSRAGSEDPERYRKTADYLSTVNLSKVSKWEYPFKTLPRLKGRSNRVIITEYDLPRKAAQPHDTIFGKDGMAWYQDFGAAFFGRLDPKTGQVTEFPVPVLLPDHPKGGLELEEDADGNLWGGLMFQAGVAKFDKKTQKFQMFPVPKELATDDSQTSMQDATHSNVDGKVWVKDQQNRSGSPVMQLDIATGKYTPMKPLLKGVGVYGISSDTQNNCYIMSLGDNHIGLVDSKTLGVKLYETPTPDSGPRRGHADSQDRLWFAEYRGNRVGMFDPKTEKVQEWAMPTPWTNPYDAMIDKNGEVWTAGMNSDRIERLNPKTGDVVEYQLPRTEGLRRVFVDSSTTPVTFWVGNNRLASIYKLEPLD